MLCERLDFPASVRQLANAMASQIIVLTFTELSTYLFAQTGFYDSIQAKKACTHTNRAQICITCTHTHIRTSMYKYVHQLDAAADAAGVADVADAAAVPHSALCLCQCVCRRDQERNMQLLDMFSAG